MGRFAATFQDGGIAGFEGKGGDVGDDFRASFKDYQKYAYGAGNAGQCEIVV
jgi:hypothetical protein